MNEKEDSQMTNKIGEQGAAIAVIGMACVYPGAHSPEELWQNVLAGRRYFRKMPAERLPRQDYFDDNPDVPGKTYCDQMAVITDWVFDPLEFRIPPVTAEASDIAHWLALSTAKTALDDAGLVLDALDRSRVGVVLGNTLAGEFSRSHTLRFRWPFVERALRRALKQHGYEKEQTDVITATVRHYYESPLPEITEDSLAGNMSNTIAGRICNYFDFGAGGYTIDGACSSSILAVAQACNALINKDMDLALAGGVDVSLDPFEIVGFAKARALAREDIRPYDEKANGMLPGEGCGIFVLAREEDARTAGFVIHALLRGWGYSSDGSGGITAPEVEGQMRALQMAYDRAGYPISSVGLIEGHGTGTALGDKVEITALRRVLEASPGSEFCWLGSIKGNIGHCKAAAGAAGLIKAIMALKRKILPPSVNCELPNPAFGRPLSRLRPTARGTVWLQNDGPRRASVSAMGFGGANSHITLEEANPHDVPLKDDLALLVGNQRSEVILLSADSVTELKKKVEDLMPTAERICRAELTDLSAALARLPHHGDIRLAIVAESPWGLAESLRSIRDSIGNDIPIEDIDDSTSGIYAGKAKKNPTLVALFPGQASQRLNMGVHLLRRYPFVLDLYERADRATADIIPRGLRPHILLNPYACIEETMEWWESLLRDTRVAQPAIVLSSIATLKVLEFLGLKPDIVIGHSLGEVSALHAAGACDDVTAIRLAAFRGLAMATLDLKDPGAMAAVSGPVDEVEKLVKSFGASLAISNFNSPTQTVVSGESAAIRDFLEICEQEGIRCQQLPVSHAFHSEIVAPAAARFQEKLEKVSFQSPSAKVISAATGREIDEDTDLKELLAEQIRKPVRFTDAVLKAMEPGPALWVEIGPKGILTNLVRDIFMDGKIECLPTDLSRDDGIGLINNILARAFVIGFPVALDRFFANRFYRPFPLEDYRPVFITDPCERQVADKEINSQQVLSGLPAGLLPAGIDRFDFEKYISKRREYLNEFIAMDYRYYSGESIPVAQSISPSPHPVKNDTPNEPQVAEGAFEPIQTAPKIDHKNVLAFAVDWIAKRTGFPKSSILPNMKLRDDLNLDSIKAGELTVVLSRKFKGKLAADPTTLANSRLADLIDVLQLNAGENNPENRSIGADEISPPKKDILARGVNAYRIIPVSAPLAAERSLSLPTGGTILLVCEPGCPRASEIAYSLERKGLTAEIVDFESLLKREKAVGLVAAVIVFPEVERTFLDCAPDEFENRVEKLAANLFDFFRFVGRSRQNQWAGFRVLALRPVSDRVDVDLDVEAAGGGFLKSFSLEQPEASFKWISLPGTWTALQWSEIAVRELERASPYVAFKYTRDGWRTMETAHAVGPGKEPGLDLGGQDVVLVSGGAKGITCELALGLARGTGAKFVLLGSSPLPDIRSGQEENEIARNLRRFAEEKINCLYMQCDITIPETVQRAVNRAELELGPITVILHGAGISKISLFEHMDFDDYLRCIRVKTRGLYNLLSATRRRRLKAVHAISSVLGRTGMSGQTDYAFANAWLDGAIRSVMTAQPHLHCLSLGYSVWSETGLGERLGVVDSLTRRGIKPITIKEGVEAYIDLVRHFHRESVFVITGNLTPELELNLFGPSSRPAPQGRYMERILHFVPGIEITAEASLSHDADLYMAQHVFEGTPLFPGVMAIEAMAEAAMACMGHDGLPVMRNIRFPRPLIIPDDAQVVIRIKARVDLHEGDTIRVQTAIQSDEDNFVENHFQAECFFGLKTPKSVDLPECPPLPEPLDKNPEEFSPAPLFQGKFFRRIAAVRKLDMGRECITEVKVPQGEEYFKGLGQDRLLTSSPAARDAFLQSGALLLPPGYLPIRVGELRLFQRPAPGSLVICRVEGMQQTENRYLANISVFSRKGAVLEMIKGIVLEVSQAGVRPPRSRAAAPVPFSQLETDLKRILAERQHALAVVEHEKLLNMQKNNAENNSFYDINNLVSGSIKGEHNSHGRQKSNSRAEQGQVLDEEIEYVRLATASPRQPSAIANLAATRQAAVAFARQYLKLGLAPTQIFLSHRYDGKPELQFKNGEASVAFQGVGVSLADESGVSVALIGPSPVGVDVEAVEGRETEIWRALLLEDGYELARLLAKETGESFDFSAARVWTMLEAVKKANDLNRIIPEYKRTIDASWLFLAGRTGLSELHFFSAILASPQSPESLVAFAVAMEANAGEEQRLQKSGRIEAGGIDDTQSRKSPLNKEGKDEITTEFDRTTSNLLVKLQGAQSLCQNDPGDPDTERHYDLVVQMIISALQDLQKAEKKLAADSLRQRQKQISQAVLLFLDGSIVFRRALEKPLGYPGDHILLDMMFHGYGTGKGLGYHFDRYFLIYPGTEAVRQRSQWVVERVETTMAEKRTNRIAILDLGCGPMAIEKTLLERSSDDCFFTITGLDFDERALDYAASRLTNPRAAITMRKRNLISPQGIAAIRQFAVDVDICICMGLIEYLEDETATAIYQAFHEVSKAGARMFTSNYRPDHFARPAMEWLLDWRLVYRTEADVLRLAKAAGFKEENCRSRLDSTGNIVLLEAMK